MKVVIDTNILVSAVIRDGLPERVLLWCLRQPDVDWLVTRDIINEYMEVIRRPKFALPHATITWWTELLVSDTKAIQSDFDIDFSRDRKDAPFLTCAASGSADYLVTGDGDFADAQGLVTTRIISARGFAEEIMGE
ncbi:MAG: putative toxin-antitoxin system toxin component, PIN family [Gammaproteobacteria bacterium]|nr:putative toxin-antitoxin system toxin component, PIN family [Gammaproteobacteria bacterium]NNJ84936.1 putative toxin-antitoxin system toxin component, PIN family [Gammaproteobacteria bacterium]